MPCRESHSLSVAFDPALLPHLLESLGGQWTLFPLGELKVVPLAGSLLGYSWRKESQRTPGSRLCRGLGQVGAFMGEHDRLLRPLRPSGPKRVGAAPFTQRLEASRTLNPLARQCLLLGASAWPHVTVGRLKQSGCTPTLQMGVEV